MTPETEWIVAHSILASVLLIFGIGLVQAIIVNIKTLQIYSYLKKYPRLRSKIMVFRYAPTPFQPIDLQNQFSFFKAVFRIWSLMLIRPFFGKSFNKKFDDSFKIKEVIATKDSRLITLLKSYRWWIRIFSIWLNIWIFGILLTTLGLFTYATLAGTIQ